MKENTNPVLSRIISPSMAIVRRASAVVVLSTEIRF